MHRSAHSLLQRLQRGGGRWLGVVLGTVIAGEGVGAEEKSKGRLQRQGCEVAGPEGQYRGGSSDWGQTVGRLKEVWKGGDRRESRWL